MAKIMLVEDDTSLLEIYKTRLAAEGYDISTAKDGEEALVMAKKVLPDLIICDIMMPKISGFDMLDILRGTPETKNVKIIMMTALSQAEDKERAEKLGADRYLVKSQVTLEDVVRVTSDVLGNVPESTSGINLSPSLPPTPNSSESAAVATTTADASAAIQEPDNTLVTNPASTTPADIPSVTPTTDTSDTPTAEPIVSASLPTDPIASLPTDPIASTPTEPNASTPTEPEPTLVSTADATPLIDSSSASTPTKTSSVMTSSDSSSITPVEMSATTSTIPTATALDNLPTEQPQVIEDKNTENTSDDTAIPVTPEVIETAEKAQTADQEEGALENKIEDFVAKPTAPAPVTPAPNDQVVTNETVASPPTTAGEPVINPSLGDTVNFKNKKVISPISDITSPGSDLNKMAIDEGHFTAADLSTADKPIPDVINTSPQIPGTPAPENQTPATPLQ